MDIHSLYKKLSACYTHDNLQKITRKIIDLHKNRQANAIAMLMNAVGDDAAEKKERTNKAFYRLMMVYHPDRLSWYRSEIDRLYAARDLGQLRQFSHIITALDLEKTLVVLRRPETDPSAYADLWEAVDEESGEYDDSGTEEGAAEESLDEFDDLVMHSSFFSIFKKQVYGNAAVELPFHYLEDIDSVDLAGCGIDDLDGIKHCTHLVSLELSSNRITDISELAPLTMLQEVYLGRNRIGYIDALQFLVHLRALDVSFNAIDDLSPLFELGQLEYLNIEGNAVPGGQIDRLRNNGVIIIS